MIFLTHFYLIKLEAFVKAKFSPTVLGNPYIGICTLSYNCNKKTPKLEYPLKEFCFEIASVYQY